MNEFLRSKRRKPRCCLGSKPKNGSGAYLYFEFRSPYGHPVNLRDRGGSMSCYLIVSFIPGSTNYVVLFRWVMTPATFGGGGSPRLRLNYIANTSR